MVTAAVTGKAGVVKIGASTVAEVTAWSVDRPVEAILATSMDSAGNNEYVEGLKGWSGSFTSLLYDALVAVGGAQAGTFQVGAVASAGAPILTGSVIITNEPVAVTVEGRTEWQYSFQGTGALTTVIA